MVAIKAIETQYKGYRFRSRLEARWAVFFDALGVKWEYEPEGFDLTDAYVEYLADMEKEKEAALNRQSRLRQAMINHDIQALGQWEYENLANKVRERRGEEKIYGWFLEPFTYFETTPVESEEIWALPEEDWPVVYFEDVPDIDTSLLLRYLPDFYLPSLDLWIEIKSGQEDDTPWSDDIRHMLFSRHARICVLFGHPGEVRPYEGQCSYVGCVVDDSPYFWCECPECGAIGVQFDGRSARNTHLPKCSVPASGSDKNYNLNSERLRQASRVAMSARFEHGEKPVI